MKTKLFTMFLLVLAGVVWGQEEESTLKTGNYYFNYPDLSNLKELSFDSKLKNTVEIEDIQKKVSGSKYRITVTKIKDEKVFFVFGKFKDTIVDNILNKPDFSKESEIAKSLFTSGTSNNKVSNKIVYNMPLKDFEENTKILYKRVDWRVGVFTIPYKLRFSDFSFDANVNIGVSLGGKIRINREKIDGFSLEPIVGFGLASIKLEDSNSSAETTTNVSAFTVNTGFLVHLTNKINLGVTYGFDNISKNDQNIYNWKYNGKGWLGIGINVAFSTGNENSGSTGNNN